MRTRGRLQWCSECNRDHPANKWRRSPIYIKPGVTLWLCPKGHHLRWCDESQHDWRQSNESLQECTRCDAQRLAFAPQDRPPTA